MPVERNETWENWSGNNVFTSGSGTVFDYVMPRSLSELQHAIGKAVNEGQKIRVSGQRHSASPIVLAEQSEPTLVVDLSCYRDIGDQGKSNVSLNRAAGTVSVNAGVLEEDLDQFLKKHHFALKTVTAGGFFSLGGMTSLEVHGAAIDESSFAENVVAYTVVDADGVQTTYDGHSPDFEGRSPLQFWRTSLGTLGVVTSVTLKVKSIGRVLPSYDAYSINEKGDFMTVYADLLSGKYNSVETFFNPYAGAQNFLALCWQDDRRDPVDQNDNTTEAWVYSSCKNATKNIWGAPLLPGPIETVSERVGMSVQNSKMHWLGMLAIQSGMSAIKGMMDVAIQNQNAMWLTQAERSIFMSYFIPLPGTGVDEPSLVRAWEALQVVTKTLNWSRRFISVLPPEFRFVRGSDALLAGNYADKDKLFIAIEVLALVPKGSPDQYPQPVLDFFAAIERQWVDMGGLPHNGKMYGFYDAHKRPGSPGVPPFNANFIDAIWRGRRPDRVGAFTAYQEKCDPSGTFSNSFTKRLLGRSVQTRSYTTQAANRTAGVGELVIKQVTTLPPVHRRVTLAMVVGAHAALAMLGPRFSSGYSKVSSGAGLFSPASSLSVVPTQFPKAHLGV